jgi:hypothetical protein
MVANNFVQIRFPAGAAEFHPSITTYTLVLESVFICQFLKKVYNVPRIEPKKLRDAELNFSTVSTPVLPLRERHPTSVERKLIRCKSLSTDRKISTL